MSQFFQNESERSLTGKHVLLMLVGFFLVIIVVNIVFIFYAIDSFRGEDVKKSYRQGLNYNATLQMREAQAASGWTADVNVQDITRTTAEATAGQQQVIVKVSDAEGQIVKGLVMEGRLRHPVDTAKDIPLTFMPGNLNRANMPKLNGRWTLEAEAAHDGEVFRLRRDLFFK